MHILHITDCADGGHLMMGNHQFFKQLGNLCTAVMWGRPTLSINYFVVVLALLKLACFKGAVVSCK